MAICSPREPVYYYECSDGGFRLVYFVPPETLERLHRADRISPQAVADFPDGVDLGCTEADFRDFEELYGWRPATDPKQIQHAFLALFSSTRRWKTFRGSGLIPARDLERYLDPVEVELRKKRLSAPPVPEHEEVASGPTAKTRQKGRVQGQRVRRALETMQVEGVDPRVDLRRQRFSKIAMQAEGDPAEVVFSMLHEKRGG